MGARMYSSDMLERLLSVLSNPCTSIQSRLVATRRICRLLSNWSTEIKTERQVLLHKALSLSAQNKFYTARAKELGMKAKNHRIDELDQVNESLVEMGQEIACFENHYSALGLPKLLDLLNVNPTDRPQFIAEIDSKNSLFTELVFVLGVEDSAQKRGCSEKDGALFKACLAAFVRAMSKRPAYVTELLESLPKPPSKPELHLVQ